MSYILVVLAILVVSATGFPSENRVEFRFGGALNKQVGVANPKLDFIQQSSGLLEQFLPQRPKGREQAVLEVPTPIQLKDSIYDKAQQLVINLIHPKPIVDTIAEHEKYGNSGDQFRSIGNAIVGGYEGFSNFLNAASDLPFETMKQVTRKATSYLSTFGAKLVGL